MNSYLKMSFSNLTVSYWFIQVSVDSCKADDERIWESRFCQVRGQMWSTFYRDSCNLCDDLVFSGYASVDFSSHMYICFP